MILADSFRPTCGPLLLVARSGLAIAWRTDAGMGQISWHMPIVAWSGRGKVAPQVSDDEELGRTQTRDLLATSLGGNATGNMTRCWQPGLHFLYFPALSLHRPKKSTVEKLQDSFRPAIAAGR